jgi:hypothetical protein
VVADGDHEGNVIDKRLHEAAPDIPEELEIVGERSSDARVGDVADEEECVEGAHS